MPINANSNEEPKIVKTDIGAKDGQNKCPKCGATDIAINEKTGHLRCNFCRYEFELEKAEGMDDDITSIEGEIMGSGAQNIVHDSNEVKTFKCSSCGAEVVIDTSEAVQARCHWCRNVLSVNEQIPNGAIPDVVLPFNTTKEEARKEIGKFVNERKFFAYPKFRKEFTTDNIIGVYFPYMLVDVNSHAKFVGQGEHEVNRYTVSSGNSKKTYYDADLYNVEREFDLAIDDISVETSASRLDKNNKNQTNNIINSIMPFDTENCVQYNSNYLKGYNSERRDTNIDQLRSIVSEQSKDIARYAANESLKNYDRGVRWDKEELEVKGRLWKTAYLPVWLYSYKQEKRGKNLLHYVAMNARTKEIMGSVPIHFPKLMFVSALIEILAYITILFLPDYDIKWFLLILGLMFFFIKFYRYRNSDVRHFHETETRRKIFNLRKVDKLVKRENGLSGSKIRGANNERVGAKVFDDNMFDIFN